MPPQMKIYRSCVLPIYAAEIIDYFLFTLVRQTFAVRRCLLNYGALVLQFRIRFRNLLFSYSILSHSILLRLFLKQTAKGRTFLRNDRGATAPW